LTGVILGDRSAARSAGTRPGRAGHQTPIREFSRSGRIHPVLTKVAICLGRPAPGGHSLSHLPVCAPHPAERAWARRYCKRRAPARTRRDRKCRIVVPKTQSSPSARHPLPRKLLDPARERCYCNRPSISSAPPTCAHSIRLWPGFRHKQEASATSCRRSASEG
jgi:hypothetical protein